MVTTTCNASDVIEYSNICLDKDPPDNCYPNYSSLAAAIWQAFLVLNIIVGLTGNLLTLLSIPYAKCHQRFGFRRDGDTTTLYILNLALCDFLFCAMPAPLILMQEVYQGWPLSKTMCAVSVILRWGLAFADWQALSLIALSRFVLLKWPKRGKIIFSGKAALVTLGIAWLVVFLALLPMTIEVRRRLSIWCRMLCAG
jgi:hypothetical protein